MTKVLHFTGIEFLKIIGRTFLSPLKLLVTWLTSILVRLKFQISKYILNCPIWSHSMPAGLLIYIIITYKNESGITKGFDETGVSEAIVKALIVYEKIKNPFKPGFHWSF